MTTVLLSVADFQNILDTTGGREVSHQVVTKTTSNITGEETLVYASGVTIACYFMRVSQEWNYENSALLEKADAVALFKIADGVDKDDRIVVDGETFRVEKLFNVPGTFDADGVGAATSFVYARGDLRLVNG